MSDMNFLQLRQKGIGGSDVGPILGVPAFSSAVDVYLSKIEPVIGDEETELTYWGHALEAPIADRFARDHKVTLDRVSAVCHPDNPWMRANIDRWIVEWDTGLEIKNVDKSRLWLWGDEDTDQVPAAYVAQCMWYMAVLERPRWHLAALFGGNLYREFLIERDLELEANIIHMCGDFWHNHVLTRIAPEPKSVADVLALHPRNNIPSVEATLETMGIIEQYRGAKAVLTRAETEKELLETRLKSYMGDAGALTFGNRNVATWTCDKRGSRVFRLK